MLIKVRNTLASQAQKTFMTYAESAGTNVLRWQNPNAFSASWGVQVGETGEEQSEVVLLGTATPAGTAGTLTANDLYEHPANTPLYAIKYDQVVFKVSTAGTAGTAVVIADGTITYQADSKFTQFDHTAGSIEYAYKTAFRSSVLAVNTTESDWIVVTPAFYSKSKLRQRVKGKLWSSAYVEDDQIDNWLNEWLDEMNNTMLDVNEDYGLGSTSVTFLGTNEFGTITATDYKSVRRIWLTTNGADYYNATKMELTSFTPDQEFNETNPYYFMYGDNVIGRRPNDAAGTAGVVYQKHTSHLDDDMDEIPLPMQAYTKSFVDYALAQAYYKDEKDAKGDRFMLSAEQSKAKFNKELVPRSKSGPTYMEIVEDLGQDTILDT